MTSEDALRARRKGAQESGLPTNRQTGNPEVGLYRPAALQSPDFVRFRMGHDLTFSWKNSINMVKRISIFTDWIGGTSAG